MEQSNVRKKDSYLLLWLILAFYITILVLSNFVLSGLWILSFPITLLFALIHAAKNYGWKAACIFIVISVIISLIYENLSIATGFPFGWYHWSADKNPGPWVGSVPLLTAIAYCGTGYISWMLACILISEPDEKVKKANIFFLPLIAAFIMVMWDISMDPMTSTVYGVWVWHHGGGFYGVPLSNFLGWYLVVYTIYQLFAIVLLFNPKWTRPIFNSQYWYQVIIFYFFIGISGLLPSEIYSKAIASDMGGRKWIVGDIYEGTLMVTIFTMGFVCLLAGMRVFQRVKTEHIG